MNVVERRGDAGQPEVEHPGRIADGVARFVPPPVIRQRAPRQKPHRHERAAVVIAMIGDRHDRFVLEGQHRVDLAGKPLRRRSILPHFAAWHLHDDRDAGSRVPRPVGHAHAARAQLRDESVAAVNQSAKKIRRLSDALGLRHHRLADRCGAGECARVTPNRTLFKQPKHLRNTGQVSRLGRVGQGRPSGTIARRIPRRVSHDGLPAVGWAHMRLRVLRAWMRRDGRPGRVSDDYDRAEGCRCPYPRGKGMFNISGRVVKGPHGASANSTRHMNHQPAHASFANEQPFRPVIRPAVPILTVLDDGSIDDGEQIRIRKDCFVIGRSSGDLTIPNDATMSSRHAEIRLTTSRGQREWTLHNLESVNGTFVRVGAAALAYDTIVLIGSRRFRLEKPAATASELPGTDTLRIDQPADPGESWPTLAESSGRTNALRFPLHSPKITIGRIGSGCDIQLDDPLVAAVHAELVADSSGGWKLIGKKSRNGIWVKTAVTPLMSCCFFQCGEQRFKFVIP